MPSNAILSKLPRLWNVDSNEVPTQLQATYIATGLATALPGSIPSLQADGTVKWLTAAGSGTVTLVNTGTGLTGGPITTSGTISLLPATSTVLGGIVPRTGLAVDALGRLDLQPAQGTSIIGGVKAGTNIQIAVDGTISAAGGSGSSRLNALLDVQVTEPTLVDTLNVISAITDTSITVTAATPTSLAIGDWIRGDETQNGECTQITNIVGADITVGKTLGLAFATTIFKLTNTGIGGLVLGYNLQINNWVAVPGGSGGGSAIQVDGATVPPTNNAINFVDSVAQLNRVQFSNTGTNRIAANLDPTSPAYVAELSISNIAGTQAITLDYPDSATASYDLVFPPNQGGAGQVLVNDGAGNLSWQTMGGGGGGSLTSTAIWTGGSANKDAYSGPSVINNVGITINLVASSGSGQVTAATISLNGTALTNTYASTGTWPNLSIVIPVADLSGNAAETAATVAISLTGTYNGTGVSIANAGTLTNNQPVAFAASVSVPYPVSQEPYYITSTNVTWTYSVTGTATTYAGSVTDSGGVARAMTTATGTTTNPLLITGLTISGSVTGTGRFGAGTSTVSVSGSTAGIPTFIPAFSGQGADSTPPTFTTSSTQTSAAAAGSTITYPVATAITQYNWVATNRPLANLMLVTPFGNSPLVPDVTGTPQVLAGQTFNVYGWTGLTVGSASQLAIT